MTQRSASSASSPAHWFARIPRWQRELLATVGIVLGMVAFVLGVGAMGLALISR